MSPNVSILKNLSSSIAPKAEKLFTKLGSNPDPLITIIALCGFNMTVRPLITLSDKNQPKERKIYAAVREFLTELVALPTCVIMSRVLGGALAKKFIQAPNTINAVKNVFSLGGLVLANFLIPIFTNIALQPIMKDVKKKMIENKKAEISQNNISQKQSLNVISESQVSAPTVYQPKQTISPTKVTNIWEYYNLTNLSNLKIGN